MENENITMEKTAETAAVEAPNKNMKPCKVCGKQIAKKAKTCPYCGAKNKKSHKGLIALLIIIVVAVATVVVIKPFGLNIIPFGTSNTEEAKAKITDNNGNVIYLTAQELMNIDNTNEAQFEYLYKGAKIEFIGTVEKITTNYRYNGSTTLHDSITFKEHWKVEMLSGKAGDLLLKMNPGTKVSVSSNISYCHGDVVLQETSSTATRISIVE